ncbi:8679_t:CDS:10 [Funneliformis caledonium]|uniref:8679_t:CDS:1 n=1 Tax=Funneliformis caledonium TaxID=1117310 RepID=A0A9N9H4B7_9GLOM|nr:8679_t:CDS:10 [Funneliformis caledonium]
MAAYMLDPCFLEESRNTDLEATGYSEFTAFTNKLFDQEKSVTLFIELVKFRQKASPYDNEIIWMSSSTLSPSHLQRENFLLLDLFIAKSEIDYVMIALNNGGNEGGDDNDDNLLNFDDIPIDSTQNGSVLPKTPSSLEQVVPKQRFVINKMILKDLSLILSFSAIVGSNGSGKSNGLDACRVDVYFEEILDLPGSDNYEVLPQSQLVISRQAFRNNASKYFINGRQSNYTEVTSPLEDVYEKGETLDEERSKKLNRLKIVEKEKQSLEAKKKEAEDYLRDENTLTLKQSALYQKKISRIEEEEKNVQIKQDNKVLEDIYRDSVNVFQQREKVANEIIVESANYEKVYINLEERKKHANSKQKKLTMKIPTDQERELEIIRESLKGM